MDDPNASVDEIRSVLDSCAEPETIDVLADVLFGHYLEPLDEIDYDHGEADSPARLFELVDRATALAPTVRSRIRRA